MREEYKESRVGSRYAKQVKVSHEIEHLFQALLRLPKCPQQCLKATCWMPEMESDRHYFDRWFRKELSEAWLEFLRLPIPAVMMKKALDVYPQDLLPYLQDPKRFHGFLTDCYDMGGSISLLALHGLFLLIQKHNL